MEKDTLQARPVAAEVLAAGQRIALPDGSGYVEVGSVDIESDDFGVPAVVVATLAGGRTLRIASGSVVSVEAVGGAPLVPAVAADDGSPEELVAQVAALHPGSDRISELAERLARGINFKSGSNLQDLHDLALTLFVDRGDTDSALRTADLLTDLGFDGNFGRWKWIESALAMAAYLTRDDEARSAAYSVALRVADESETDPLRAKVNAAVRQRQLNNPNLYDPEILRATAAGNRAAEKDWRVLRFGVLLYLRAHGGSETLSRDVLDRRIANELSAVAGLASAS
ncbi:hypothetical protein E2F48_13475 [Arthrobacter crusticola]|uniref:Uncharacterized protein n=1 Tax=Arthrobacter crusticola TaxID=2547960 RepID=A0A4R5TUS9_9MICC|nr:DUF6707 family protein [Arthrobacter crusticola]TDK24807.1 hypothetical protein E2F48_13475 [Arthrobacter crusticola]